MANICLDMNPNEIRITEIARDRVKCSELANKIIVCNPEASKIICLAGIDNDAVLGYISAREGIKQLDLLIIDACSKWELGGYEYYDSRFVITDSRELEVLHDIIYSTPFIFISEVALGEYERQELFKSGIIPNNSCCVSLFSKY